MKILPVHPNLDYLLREAKAIKSRHRNGDKNVCPVLGHFDTSLHGLTTEQILNKRFSILDAQRVIARQYGFASWTKMKNFVSLCDKGQKPIDPHLRKYTLKRYEILQGLQQEVKQKKLAYEEYKQETLISTRVLSEAYEVHGWPGPDIIGSDCVNALWFVAASAVYDSEFQRRTVAMTADALPNGKIFGHTYAGVKDRYLTLKKKPTIYGLAFGAYYDAEGEFHLCIPAIEDPKNVDKRRAIVGHQSLQEERNRCAEDAKKYNWKYGDRAEAIEELNRVSIEGGYT